MPWMFADIKEIEPLTNTIVKLVLKPDTYVAYQAGQYLQMRAGEYLAYFSIANAPLGSKLYELHIRHEKHHESSQAILKYLQEKAKVEIRLPQGLCHLGHFDTKKPLIFIAGGTGFAPIKAVIEYLLYRDDPRTFECYWLAKQPSDLYWQQELQAWQSHVSNFKHLGLYAGKNVDKVLHEIHERHGENLKNFQWVLAGAFEMVYTCREELLAWGVSQKDMFSDAFEFEK
jgi:CDP-4-dehydro-6-deoxyglucose reductase